MTLARRVGAWLLVLVAIVATVGGGLVATGVVDVNPSKAPWVSDEEAASKEAAELTAEDVQGDGVAPAGHKPRDLTGQEIVPEDEGETASAGGLDGDPVISGPAGPFASDGRLRAPSVGMDVSLATMKVAPGGKIVPPGYRAGYLLDGMGSGLSDPAAGRVFIATHSVTHGFSPGNYIVSKHGTARLSVGDKVSAGPFTYTVKRTEMIDKTALPKDQDVWADEPGTLVIITCRPNDGAKTTQNSVVFATLDSAA